MNLIKIKKNFSKGEIALIVDALKLGKVIVYPTDTIYGLGCSALSKKAIKKIYAIKRREEKKPLLVLVNSLAMAKKYCQINRKQELYLKGIWPGPVSAILKVKKDLPKELSAGGDSLALRLPKNDFLIRIIRILKAPLVSTSVNISGEKSLVSVKDAESYFKQKNPPHPLYQGGLNPPTPPLLKGARIELPDLIIDVGVLKGKPSKLIDLRDAGHIKIIRK